MEKTIDPDIENNTRSERIVDLFGMKWMNILNLKYERIEGKIRGTFIWVDGPNFIDSRTLSQKQGTFHYHGTTDKNRVILAYHKGMVLAAPYSEERERILEQNGFLHRETMIPGLLDHEKLKDQELQMQFENL